MGLRNRTFTDEQFIEAVRNSISKAGVLKLLSMAPAGGNYRMFNILVKRLALDTSHFKGRGYLKGQTHIWTKKVPLEQILKIDSEYNRGYLKKRLIQDGKLKNECARCGCLEWQGEKLSLHLDHINGVNNDNRLENLRLLCPNCHSLTPTYCGKKLKGKLKVKKTKAVYSCLDCSKAVGHKSTRCRSCAGKQKKTKITWPPIKELLEMVKSSSYSAVGIILGVSDNAVRKRFKHH